MPQFDRLGNDMSDDIADELAAEEEKVWGSPVGGQGMEDDMWVDQEEEAREDDFGAQFGDARRCHRHPHIKVSSDDGMFDGVCGQCEYEMDAHSDYDDWKERLVASGPTCTDNGFKLDVSNDRHGLGGSTCQDWNYCRPVCLTGNEVPDLEDIPF